MDDSMNFNEIFRKNVTCDNIKSHKISGLHSLSLSLSLESTISEKNRNGSNWPPPAFLGLSRMWKIRFLPDFFSECDWRVIRCNLGFTPIYSDKQTLSTSSDFSSISFRLILCNSTKLRAFLVSGKCMTLEETVSINQWLWYNWKLLGKI